MRLLFVIAAATCAGTALASSSRVIYSDSSIGGFHERQNFGRLSQAIAVFGEPRTLRRTGPYNICTAGWTSLGLVIKFNAYKPGCVPESSCFYQATITGLNWHTEKGLAIGDSRQRLYQLYPRVTASGEWRALVVRPGLEGTYPAVEARLPGTRITAFRVSAGSCEGFRG